MVGARLLLGVEKVVVGWAVEAMVVVKEVAMEVEEE
jgi:hypothetical protein